MMCPKNSLGQISRQQKTPRCLRAPKSSTLDCNLKGISQLAEKGATGRAEKWENHAVNERVVSPKTTY